MRRSIIFSTIIVLALQFALPCFAQQQIYDRAVIEYKNQNFKQAAQLFNQYISNEIGADKSALSQQPQATENPSFAYAMLYEAVCLDKIGDSDDASTIYGLVIRRYKGSKLANQAQKLLYQLQTSHPKNKLSARDSSLDSLPKETWVPFTPYGNLMLVEGYINNQHTGMLFDTGAAGCLFSTEQLKALGISIPATAPVTSVAGVGKQKQTPAWTMPVDLSLGRIRRRQFPVQINENPLSYPLLGVNFFEGLEYTIDNQAKTIQFKKIANQQDAYQSNGKMTITVDTSSHYVYNVPFSEINGAIIVIGKIAGKDCQMILDTGTDYCLFTSKQLRQFGLLPKFTGQVLNCKGAAGYIKAPLCLFDKAEFGPIAGSMTCLVTDDAALPMPLLGQNFLKGWQITIDHNQHLVKLIRK